MASVAVFDSGLGSLSIVRAIRESTCCDITYYADTLSHPYGAKPPGVLCGIVRRTIGFIQERFRPDLVVVGSNTPTLLCEGIEDGRVIGVWPPLAEAARISRRVSVLATKSVVSGSYLEEYARSLNLPITIDKVDAGGLVRLVETGAFLRDYNKTARAVQDVVAGVSEACTLSSTHLPFLRGFMERARPDVTFLDPAAEVARRAAKITGGEGNSALRVYASDASNITESLRALGVAEDVVTLRPS